MRWLNKLFGINSNPEPENSTLESEKSDGEPEIFTLGGRFDFRFPHEKNHFIVPKYESVKVFKEGLAAVELCGKWGYIDQTRREVIRPKYDQAESFSEGLARVKLNNKWGFVDKMGRERVPLIYDEAGDFTGGLAYARLNGNLIYIDQNGTERSGS